MNERELNQVLENKNFLLHCYNFAKKVALTSYLRNVIVVSQTTLQLINFQIEMHRKVLINLDPHRKKGEGNICPYYVYIVTYLNTFITFLGSRYGTRYGSNLFCICIASGWWENKVERVINETKRLHAYVFWYISASKEQMRVVSITKRKKL